MYYISDSLNRNHSFIAFLVCECDLLAPLLLHYRIPMKDPLLLMHCILYTLFFFFLFIFDFLMPLLCLDCCIYHLLDQFYCPLSSPMPKGRHFWPQEPTEWDEIYLFPDILERITIWDGVDNEKDINIWVGKRSQLCELLLSCGIPAWRK